LKEQIRTLVVTAFGLGDDVADDASLFASGLLDSLSAVTLLTELEDKLGVVLSPLEVALDDVDSIDAITATVEKFG